MIMIKQVSIFFTCLFIVSISSAQSWKPTSSPPGFLSEHTFGFAIDGKGYLVAGNEEFYGPSNDFWQYDPMTDVWTELDTFPGAGRGYSIGDVWDGKAYFGFGTTTTEILNDLWVFDPDSMRWTQLETCPCEPRLHPALVALNGKIFAGLGNGASGNMNDWWEYDIATNKWAQKPDFPNTRRHHPYQFAAGDHVYTGFGHGTGIFKDWYRYNPVLETWDRMADIPDEGRVAGTQFSHDNKGYVLSGDGGDHLSMEEGEFWEYDPAFNAWTQLPSHPGKSRWAPASFIIDSVVYLFNGTTYFEGSGYVYQEQAYKFVLETKEVYPNIERIVSHLYNTVIYDIEPMTHGRWALAVKDSPVPLALGEDSLSIVILDSIGATEKRIIIDAFVQNERTVMGPIWILPNGEIVIRYGVGNCDTDIFEYALEKFDSTGASVWHLIFEDWYSPMSLSIAPDGNILYQWGVMLMKIDSETGEIMWEYGVTFDSPASYLFVPGTEDIILGDTSGLKYFSQVIIGDIYTYELTISEDMNLGTGFMTLLGIDEQNVFYGMDSETKEIYRFRKDLQPSFVMVMPDELNAFYNKFSFSENQFAIGLNFPDLEVRVYDTLGQWLHTYENDLAGLSVNDIELTEGGLAVSGNYQSGPTADDYPAFMYDQGREEGWFKFISNSTKEDTTTIVSLAVIDIEQLEAPVIDSFFSPGPEPGTLYNITGGKFRIQVTNTGNEEIHSFSVNIVFDYRINVWFCGPVSAGHIDFENQVINPGESIWVEFTDLLAEDQKIIPPQFCFWTSAPNNLPDGNPNDDMHCIDNLVSTQPIAENSFSISPNPANSEITLHWNSETTHDLIWKLIDVHGRVLKSGQLNNNSRVETIDVSSLSEGIYYFISDNGSGTVVIQR